MKKILLQISLILGTLLSLNLNADPIKSIEILGLNAISRGTVFKLPSCLKLETTTTHKFRLKLFAHFIKLTFLKTSKYRKIAKY